MPTAKKRITIEHLQAALRWAGGEHVREGDSKLLGQIVTDPTEAAAEILYDLLERIAAIADKQAERNRNPRVGEAEPWETVAEIARGKRIAP